MNKTIQWRVSITAVLEYILAFLLVLECNTVYQRATYINLHLDYLCVIVAFLLALTALKRGVSVKTVQTVFLFVVIFLIYLLFTYQRNNNKTYVLLLCLFFPLMMLYLNDLKDTEKILSIYRKFLNIVVILTALSTIIWFCSEILHFFSPNMDITIAWGGVHSVKGVFGLSFQCQIDNTFGFGSFYRNSGIFCESPTFSLVTTFALIYELFLRGSYKKIKIIILCLGIISSITSTGIIMLGICAGLLCWRQMQTKKTWVKVLYICGFLIIIPIAYYLLQSIMNTKSSTGSYTIRMIDYYVGFLAFKDHPIFGTGFNNLSNLWTYKSVLYRQEGFSSTELGFSNSLSAIIAQGGLYLSVIYLLPFVVLLIRGNKSQDLNWRPWVITFLILFSVTMFPAKFIMAYFLVAAYVCCMKKDVKRLRPRKDKGYIGEVI